MRHVFKAVKPGWDEECDGIWFDSDMYSREEAEAELGLGLGQYYRHDDDGIPYTCYEYDGQEYADIVYLGEFEDEDMPMSDYDLGL